jgi:pimeloyl-ACP methyl ester carboxylesterase
VLGSSTAGMAALAAQPPLAGRRTLLVDLLGFGSSDWPTDFSYSIEDHAATIVRLLDELELHDTEVVAFSAGVPIAVLAAVQRPQRVGALVLLEGNLDPEPGLFSGWAAGMSEEEFVERGLPEFIAEREVRSRQEPESVWPIHTGAAKACAPVAAHRFSRSLIADTEATTRELLRDLPMRRTFIVGGRSEWPPDEDLVGAGVGWLVVPGVGHLMCYEDPAGVAHGVASALDSG